ncbi:helix-turn-helix transcriptional regulator [Laspinema sp. D1]|uniref:Helix-turn-helix transcriptional regulator n=2 Tax=Laspinema TaxID=2584823 RepID=A0ABT2MJU0_9CYAN|nr:helix-turn-helix transcriptional regulator [Laspinema sp. D2a]
MDNSNKRQPPPLPDERPAVLKFGSEIEIVCNLDAIMQSRGISQMALSQETGLSASVIRSYQRNSARRWDAGTIQALIAYFHLSSLDELFTIRYKKGVTDKL